MGNWVSSSADSAELQTKVTNCSDVYAFLRTNWEKILEEKINNEGHSNLCEKFAQSLDGTDPSIIALKAFQDETRSDARKEFESKLNDPGYMTKEQFNNIKNDPVFPDGDKRYAHETYWTNVEGMKRAAALPQCKPAHNEYYQCVVNYLAKLSEKWYSPESKVHMYDLETLSKYKYFNMSQILEFIGEMLKVQIKRSTDEADNLIEEKYKVEVYTVASDDKIRGYFYLNLNTKVHAQKHYLVPCGSTLGNPQDLPRTLIMSDMQYSIVPLIVHAVHNCFVPFWDMNMDLHEVLPTIVFKKIRELYGVPTTTDFIRIQTSLAMADLLSNSPEEFNQIFETYCNVGGSCDIVSRFWHYQKKHYAGRYYTYVLGLMATDENLPQMIRVADYGNLIQYSEGNEFNH